MTTLYLEVDGKPVPAGQCSWVQIAPCGCACGVSVAGRLLGRVYMSGEEAFGEGRTKPQREADARIGFKYKLITRDQYLNEYADKLGAGCSHSPQWGIDPIPVPDGYTWLTTDSSFGRRSYIKHLVPADVANDYRATAKALCGKANQRMQTWSGHDHDLYDCAGCTRCEKRARDTSPALPEAAS